MTPSARLLALSFVALLAALPARAQDEPAPKALTVFLDCDRCDFSYIRREITFVNYVRDRTQAQVHLLITIGQSTTATSSARIDLRQAMKPETARPR